MHTPKTVSVVTRIFGLVIIGSLCEQALCCELSFKGTEFFISISDRGILPQSNCMARDYRNNRFYASATAGCNINFFDGVFSKGGVQISSITGTGRAKSIRRNSPNPNISGWSIEIEPSEGYTMDRISLTIQTDNCENISIENAVQLLQG